MLGNVESTIYAFSTNKWPQMWPHRVSDWQSIARFERVSSRRPIGLDMSVADESRPVGNQDLIDVVTWHSEVFAVFRTAFLSSGRRSQMTAGYQTLLGSDRAVPASRRQRVRFPIAPPLTNTPR